MGKTKDIRLIAVYRPYPSTSNGLKTSEFLDEFEVFLGDISLLPGKVLLTGDFNIHMDEPEKSEVKRFTCSILDAGLEQSVNVPTHKDGHTIDLLIAHPEDNLIVEWKVTDTLLSDHFFVGCTLQRKKPDPVKIMKFSRDYHNMDTNTFIGDLNKHLLEAKPTDVSANDLVAHYETSLSSIVDKHCPLTTRRYTIRPRMPWYNDTIHEARRDRRRLENKWRKSRLNTDKDRYIVQKDIVEDLIVKAKSSYFHDKLFTANSKQQFATLNSLLNNNTKLLPVSDSECQLAERFADFFVDKIQTIRQNLDMESDLGVSNNVSIDGNNMCISDGADVTCNLHNLSDDMKGVESIESHDVTELHELKPATLEEIDRTLKKCSNKSCLLDPIPTWLLKDHSTLFIPILAEIVNVSFNTGIFPDSLKDAIITPVIKKQSMDPNILKNYRPISNIKVVAKVAEMVASSRLTEHLNQNNLNESFQSAYKPLHSTETALLRVKNDIASAIDNKNAVFLVMLDLSAAFDTIDHTIFVNRLCHTFHIQGCALQWFASYLKNRKNRVCISGQFSNEHVLNFGLPQGSILGPRGYTMYTHPVGDILRRNNVSFHIYADDTQVYVSFDPRIPDECERALNRLKTCVHQIKSWMSQNKLQLNQEKTEFYIAASSRFISNLSGIKLNLDGVIIEPTLTLKNLGVIFDPVLNMSSQISSVVKCVSFHLRNLSRIRRF
ncbi:uncharacterized protein [Amphiura filiformis]|uniref:uncharacterized protein n=1 Tax=Amphiura filiformis TaxID=82378 RepID=UPI003B20F72D